MSFKPVSAIATVLMLGAAAIACATTTPPQAAPAETTSQRTVDPSKPTIVLVHGAFADSSSWNGVVSRLQQHGYPVLAPANQLRGLESDAASIKSVLKNVTGPVVLVGHSYGGAVNSLAARDEASVKALVYIAAFLPDTGESAVDLANKYPGAKFSPTTLRSVKYTMADGKEGSDTYIRAEHFRDVFAADVSESTAALMAATQRPVEIAALTTKFPGVPAWKTVPSWSLVASGDNAIPAASERFMSERAKAHTVEVNASHAVSVSQPEAVANIIEEAARSVK
ncbi:alpha/beta hydrolase [Pendulispora rubella]|uniref:Alpha/beta hydrolase n=1 Tax=Pendulispora rubella TaxID=2741070 RepID=A0ABZ2KVU3_9BACT